MNNKRNIIQRLYWGVDFSILGKCNADLISYILYEIGIIAIALYSFNSNPIFGVIVFIVYKLFLSNWHYTITHNSGISKFILMLFLIGVSLYLQNYDFLNIYEIDLIKIVLIAIFYFVPIRFSVKSDSLYVKLLQDKLKKEKEWATDAVNKMLDDENRKREAEIEINKLADEITNKRIAEEIATSRVNIAKILIQEWEKEQTQNIKNNINKYIQTS